MAGGGSEDKGMSSEEISGMTDANLVVAIARWRQEALAEAYRRHGGGVSGLARHLLGDGESAKDVAQEVFLRLWKQPERFDPSRGSLRSYLPAQTRGRSPLPISLETPTGRWPASSGNPKAPSKAASALGCAVCADP